ncbi:dual specificity phosphatase, catalytic domain-containing protein [Toxoplasma gondii]|uniref:Dual specificity phosphatase, catalytic domain-containing protein n=1 Tax=Toxoplasma gondii TaxID=5811 RepID=A0A7J6JXT5_TOXGO|nr:dual specificity phosphatase, catalytic domain-containing protein [Toxoplasma gondii]
MFASAANAADGLRTCPVAQNPQAQESLKKPGSRDELEIAENTKKEFGLHSKAASASRPTESHKPHGGINRKSDSPSAFLTPEYGDLSRQHPAAPLCHSTSLISHTLVSLCMSCESALATPFSPLLAEALQAVSGHQLEAFFLRSSERRRCCERISEKIRQRFFLVHKCRVGAQTHPEEIRQRICGGGQLDDGATFWRSEENKHFFQMYTTEKSRSRSARASAPSQSSPGPGTSSADSRVLNPYERTGFSTHQPAPAYLRVPGRVHRLVPRHLSRAPSPTPNFNRGTLGKPRWRL